MLDTMRQLRKKKGLTMKELGEQVGVAEITISTYETGKREPSLDVLCKVADVLDVSLDMLVRGKEKDHSEEWSKKQALSRLESYSLEELQDLMAIYAVIADRKARRQSSDQGSSETK